MNNKLTELQRSNHACPDCGDDPNDPYMHKTTCRRVGMKTIGYGWLQIGPPWNDWPDDVEPVNPRAAQ